MNLRILRLSPFDEVHDLGRELVAALRPALTWQQACQSVLLDGERMAGLCREFDISRQTGYKIYARYKDCGLHGLTDRSRRPYRQANRLPFQIESLIVQLRKEHPS